MTMLYTVSKFLHILGAIVWIGGIVAVSILNARLVRDEDPVVIAPLARQSAFFGKSVLGPAAGVTLAAGIVMLAVAGIGFPLWIIWGLVVMFLSGAIGSNVLQPASTRLGRHIESADPDVAAIELLRQRIVRFSAINILLLISAVWAMVFRPNF